MVRADPHSPQVTLGLGREHICQTPELRSPGRPGRGGIRAGRPCEGFVPQTRGTGSATEGHPWLQRGAPAAQGRVLNAPGV